jgi:hypothetical protein
MLDSNNPEVNLYGVKITGLRRLIMGIDKDGVIALPDKKEAQKQVKLFNEYLITNQSVETKLRENKDIQGIKI